jgi:hypothetical protein
MGYFLHFGFAEKKTGGGKLRRKTLRHCRLATRRAMPEMKRCSRTQQEVTALAAPIELLIKRRQRVGHQLLL